MQPNKIVYRLMPTPIGECIAGATAKGLCLFEFSDRGGLDRIAARVLRRYRSALTPGDSTHIDQAVAEMTEYFRGSRKSFDVPLDVDGTPFELKVWKELLCIPYGETRTYGQLAANLGKPGAARAVGRANGANYVAVIIPCHRVIEEGGGLRGYGGGLWRKRYLLDLESNHRGELLLPAIPAPMDDASVAL
jgi:AraC family transcriptional regulator, regulatory protein of adaptative response / methylated-DNA-[protein]-cysteine methyltransferase